MDMLVNLMALPKRTELPGVVIKRPLPFQHEHVRQFVTAHFNSAWTDEIAPGLARLPASLFVSLRDGLVVGFAAYDCSGRGVFGPEGVCEKERANGIGREILLACMWAMRDEGYVYAAIVGVGPMDFYAKSVGAVPIAGSDPGMYGDPITGWSA